MEWSKRARELDPLAVTGTGLAWILFSARRYDEAIRELHAKLAVTRQKGYVPTAPFAQAYVGLADYDAAFAWFERAYEEKSNILQWIKVEPFPDVMRNDPRFADLIHLVGLDQAR